MRLRKWMGPLLVTLISILVFFGLRSSQHLDHMFIIPRGHFYIVTVVSILAIMIAIAIGIMGSRIRNVQVTLLSLAFISLAIMISVHGLSTPNQLLHMTHLPGFSAQLSVVLASIWMWLSSLPSDHPLIHRLSDLKGKLVPAWTTGLSIFAVIGMVFTEYIDLIPLDKPPVKWTVAMLVVFMCTITGYRYYQSYRYSHFPLHLSIVYSCGLLACSQIIMSAGDVWRLSWWLYHFLLLFSVMGMILGLIQQYSLNQLSGIKLRSLFTTDPIERVTNALSPSIRALILATEERDTYTAGHNFRVTLYALKLGEELGLKQDQLRALAQGSIVHDVGKIDIPDEVLNKPGKLTEEERKIIEQHPVRGYELCRSFGFMKEELEITRSHHEKWDGTGYPDQLAGGQIPLLARIVAVADVYDALTSSRSYRSAWTHDQAITLINDGKGTHFDPVCVSAWNKVCEREPQIYTYPNKLIAERDLPSIMPTA